MLGLFLGGKQVKIDMQAVWAEAKKDLASDPKLMGRKGGQSKSILKQQAARRNGVKGGRARKFRGNVTT